MNEFTHPAALLSLPHDRARVKRTFDELAQTAPNLASGALLSVLEAAAGNSPYLARLILKEPAFLQTYLNEGPAVLDGLAGQALAVESQNNLESTMRALRLAKRQTALAIALADLAGVYGLVQVTAALSRFADASVKGALRYLLKEAARKSELAPVSPQALEEGTGLVVLAMGKHGACELNYSSDIDLVIFYDEDKFPFQRGGDKRSAAVDLVKGLVKLLSETTVDGYVFRVDLRLRPDAGGTQIAISTAAAELYYESMGQNWERAAMIKARQCAGDPDAGARFLKAMEPYVWRKYLDYAAIADIHSIKRQIHAHQGHHKIAVAGHNIKLGRGGIREIEFFAQTQQLILGGRDPSLRERSTLGALRALRARGAISAEAERDLADAYLFLRTLEHRLQMIDDQQTHTLPKARQDLDHVARFMGYADTRAFEQTLTAQLTKVQGHYARLFEREAPLAADVGSLVFTGVEEDPETVSTLTRMGFARAGNISAVIRGWHHGRIRATRSARARELLTRLVPALLEALSKTADPDAAFTHFDRFLSGLPAGVQVFSMVLANPRLLTLIAEISGSAPRLAAYLGRHPSVLDALIDAEFLSRVPGQDELANRLAAEFARSPGYEASLDAARRFTKEETFRIGVQVIQGLSTPEEAGPAYAFVAETVIAGLQRIVERDIDSTHGRVTDGAFCVVALGKLGGREMTATSDLDLVFIYEHAPNVTASDGAKPLSPSAYFARLSQRFISALTALTAEGPLYEVDMRLRPSGNQGPVAVRFDTFVEYHKTQSWTWERMALTRARALSGPLGLARKVEAAICSVLTRPSDCTVTLADGRTMREKLSAQFPGRDIWDMKYAAGGLIDIEFIAQVLQLCQAMKNRNVLDPNTIGALEKLKQGEALSADDTEILVIAARLLHGLTQVLRIAVEGPFKPDTATLGLKSLLARAGHAQDFSVLERQLAESETHVRAIFDRLMPPPF